MSIKSSISLTEQQDAFARSLVEAGRYSSLSSVLQNGLELLRQKTDAEATETAALRLLIERRMTGPAISAAEMVCAEGCAPNDNCGGYFLRRVGPYPDICLSACWTNRQPCRHLLSNQAGWAPNISPFRRDNRALSFLSDILHTKNNITY